MCGKCLRTTPGLARARRGPCGADPRTRGLSAECFAMSLVGGESRCYEVQDG